MIQGQLINFVQLTNQFKIWSCNYDLCEPECKSSDRGHDGSITNLRSGRLSGEVSSTNTLAVCTKIFKCFSFSSKPFLRRSLGSLLKTWSGTQIQEWRCSNRYNSVGIGHTNVFRGMGEQLVEHLGQWHFRWSEETSDELQNCSWYNK